MIAAEIQNCTVSDDRSLLNRVQQGDEQAMQSLHKRYSKLVYSVALRTLQEHSSAEDIHQEIFLQLWRSSPRPTELRGNLGGWLATISRNRSIDMLRKQRPEVSLDNVVVAASRDLFSDCTKNLMLERLADHMRHLSEKEQRLLAMAYVEGCTHSEISIMTGIPLGTVKTVIRGALSALRLCTGGGQAGARPGRCANLIPLY
ncbi:MAG: polymerase, sigma-24 subunit, subfamily [Acidobacteriaceae bacterium]|nr:polymerase, sigma-24 subunit, subfamily [Acidobacteriaceae bacterium]